MANNMDIQEIMKHQAVVNCGLIGSVSNGKSSTIRCLTGVVTQKHSSEKQRNITIKMGYANAKIYKCSNCEEPNCYQSGPSHEMERECESCKQNMILVNHISFLDNPGHVSFLSTLLSSRCLMDCNILVEALNSPDLPSHQSMEHINATKISKVPNVMICLNKCDLINKEMAYKNIEKLRDELKNTELCDSPMIPVSATFNINYDVVCSHLAKIKAPERNFDKTKMIVVRSFDVNRPGIKIEDMRGGIIGGSVVSGILKIGDRIELRPGYTKQIIQESKKKGKEGTKKWVYSPLKGKVLSIKSEENDLQFAICGGLVGVQLDVDPALTHNDGLVGNILTLEGTEQTVFCELAIDCSLIKEQYELNVNDKVQLNINAYNTNGEINKIIDGSYVVKLDVPICAIKDEFVTICKDNKVYGIGKIVDGLEVPIMQ
jgi:translation initiation factor 2 subunit 3